jgi:myo-inositol-1-phosphate synthase
MSKILAATLLAAAVAVTALAAATAPARATYPGATSGRIAFGINVGGNTDFLNMLNHSRLRMKKISKTEAVQSQLQKPLDLENIHIGPSDYIPWLNDNKVCFLRMEGRGFGNVPLHLEMRLSVEDSPNSAGVVIDAIRCCKIARDRKTGGSLVSASACRWRR